LRTSSNTIGRHGGVKSAVGDKSIVPTRAKEGVDVGHTTVAVVNVGVFELKTIHCARNTSD